MDLLRRTLNSPNKRTLGIIFIVAIILSIPITLTLLSQQQDIRQRAQTTEQTALDVHFNVQSSLGSVIADSNAFFSENMPLEAKPGETLTMGYNICVGSQADAQNVRVKDPTNANDPNEFTRLGAIGAGTCWPVGPFSQTAPVSGGKTYFVQTFADNAQTTKQASVTVSVGSTTNKPPNTPSPPTGDSKCKLNTLCNYAVIQTSDPDGDRFNTEINWGDGTVNDCSSDFYPPGSTCEWQHQWSKSGTYCVKARAFDVNQNFSNWSSCLNVSVSEVVSPFSISGLVFIDTDKDGTKDTGEKGFSGATVIITGDVRKQTDSSGAYSFPLQSRGYYSVALVVPSGYKITKTTGDTNTEDQGGEKQEDLDSLDAVPFWVDDISPEATVNWGIMQTTTPTSTPTRTPTPRPPTATSAPPTATTRPTSTTAPTATTTPGQPTATRTPTTTSTPPVATPTISPNEARIAVELLLPGIGSNTALGQNPNPVIRNHTVELQIFNSQNQKAKDAQGIVSFDPQTFSFKGTISLGPGLQAGVYTIKVRLFNTLWKSLGIVNIDPGNTSRTSSAKLISGDLDQNNELNLFDYNTMLFCYGANQCPQKTRADLNIDGQVDEKDLNILYAGFAKREGD